MSVTDRATWLLQEDKFAIDFGWLAGVTNQAHFRFQQAAVPAELHEAVGRVSRFILGRTEGDVRKL